MLANIKGWQTDLKTGSIIPGSVFEDKNTVQNDLKYYLAYKIGTDTTDQALDNLFPTDDTPVVGDGIAHGVSSTEITEVFATSLSTGGDNSTVYIEFYGYIDGDDPSTSLTNNLYLGYGLTLGPSEFSKEYASYDINTSVTLGRRFHFYWRVTIN